MTKDEALDLALEALENSVDLVREDAYNAEKLYGNYPTRQGKVRGLKALADDHEKAITAIKQALAAPTVQEPVAIPEYIRDAAKHLHENRFEPSFMVRAIVGWINGSPPAQPAPVQEPVCKECNGSGEIETGIGMMACTDCSPAQPAPVPLTDEQIESLLPDDDTPMSLGEAFVKFARLVEAAHGITKGQS